MRGTINKTMSKEEVVNYLCKELKKDGINLAEVVESYGGEEAYFKRIAEIIKCSIQQKEITTT